MTFVLSKLFWFLLEPGNLLLVLLVVGFIHALVRKGQAEILIAVATIGFLIFAVLPAGQLLALPLEDRFPAATQLPDRVDGIIVLGGAIDTALTQARGQVTLGSPAARITEAVVLARRYPAARILVSGGEGTLVTYGLPEADAMRRLLIQLGVAADRIEVESGSRNTYENAVNSFAVAKPRPDQVWLLVTSAMHMPRAVGCFRRAGWHVLPVPVDYRTMGGWHFEPGFDLAVGLDRAGLAMKEWVGLLAYYWLGRTDALFPGPGS